MKEVEEIRNQIEPLEAHAPYTEDEIRILHGEICPYCGKPTELIDSAEIYRGVSYGPVYICRPCHAYVGCYHFTNKALGRLADENLRAAKHKAHHYFDQLWKRKIMQRPVAYQFLSEMMGTPREYTHIGMYNEEQCQRVIQISICLLQSRGKEPYPYEKEKSENSCQ